MNEGTRGNFKVRALTYGDGFGQTLRAAILAITNAQAKALRATPVTIVVAPGAGKIAVPVSLVVSMVYGGTNAFVQGGAGEHFGVKHKDGTTSPILQAGIGTFVQATASGLAFGIPGGAIGAAPSVTKANGDNQPLVIHNITAAELTGNAGADNTFLVTLTYVIQPSGV